MPRSMLTVALIAAAVLIVLLTWGVEPWQARAAATVALLASGVVAGMWIEARE